MTEQIRVKWKSVGHESTIPADRFDGDRHLRLDKPATDVGGNVLPPKFKTTVAKSAGKGSTSKATRDGQSADDQKES